MVRDENETTKFRLGRILHKLRTIASEAGSAPFEVNIIVQAIDHKLFIKEDMKVCTKEPRKSAEKGAVGMNEVRTMRI